jgi:hypothetical protein
MLTKNHKQNTNFQIAYFLAGSCHTPDAAYALLLDLREERQAAVDNYHVCQIRDAAKELKAKKLLESTDEVDKLNGEADMLELSNNRRTSLVLFKAASEEIEFINRCIAALQPLRRYAHLSDQEANEAVQDQEWKLELLHRAENALITTGNVPVDHFATMRMHPAFQAEIMPRIKEMTAMLQSREGAEELHKQIGGVKFECITKLLE